MIQPSEDPKSIGEMVGLRWSTFLLQKRFGTRQFPYPVHVHKAINKPLLLESRMTWSKEFEQATLHRFRADGRLANSHTVSLPRCSFLAAPLLTGLSSYSMA